VIIWPLALTTSPLPHSTDFARAIWRRVRLDYRNRSFDRSASRTSAEIPSAGARRRTGASWNVSCEKFGAQARRPVWTRKKQPSNWKIKNSALRDDSFYISGMKIPDRGANGSSPPSEPV